MLEQAGHAITLASNSKVALELLSLHAFDLVFLDIQMPGMDGISTIKEIRKNDDLNSLPVIALTANVMTDEIQHYLQIGFDKHVGKPFTNQSLLSALVR